MLGVILAGGASSRMGRDKALVEVAGKSMLAWVADALSEVVDEVLVSGVERPGFVAIPDVGDPFHGPLAGIRAVALARPEPFLLVAVDQPWVRSATLRHLASLLGERPVVPTEHGVRQVLCAAYPGGLADLAGQELRAGGSIQSMLDVTSFDAVSDWEPLGEDGRSWYSADSRQALDEGLRRYGPPG